MFSFVFWNVRKLTELIPLDPAIISIELLELTRILTNEIKWCVHEICDVVWDDCISINVFRSIQLEWKLLLFSYFTCYAMRRDGKKANGTICNAFAHLERTVANHRNVFLCNDGRFESNTCSWHVCRHRSSSLYESKRIQITFYTTSQHVIFPRQTLR